MAHQGPAAGGYPRVREAGVSALLHSQNPAAGGYSHAAYASWKRHGVPTARHQQQQPNQVFGAPTVRGEGPDVWFGGGYAGADPPPPVSQQKRARNPVTWEGAADDEPTSRPNWDPLRREELRTDAASPRWPDAHMQPLAQPQPPHQPPQALAEKEKENPSKTWGQLMRTRPVVPSAALCMVDALTNAEDSMVPERGPRLPADNFKYIGMRVPGQAAQNHRRTHTFSNTFSDPFM